MAAVLTVSQDSSVSIALGGRFFVDFWKSLAGAFVLGLSALAAGPGSTQGFGPEAVEGQLRELTEQLPPARPIENMKRFLDRILGEFFWTPGLREELRDPIERDPRFREAQEVPLWLHGIDVVSPGYATETIGRPIAGWGGDEVTSLVWIAGWDGLILHSEDDGAHWVRQESGVSEHLQSIDFVDERHGMAVGHAGTVLRTEDGGASWERGGAAGDQIHLAVDCLDRSHCWLVGAYPTVYTTADGGSSWEQTALPESEELLAIKMFSPEVGVAGGSHAIWRTEDGGRSWSPAYKIARPEGATDVQSINGVHTADGRNVWAVGRIGGDLAILKSEDAGVTWASQTENIFPRDYLDLSALPEEATAVHRATAVFATSAEHAVVVGTNGVILATVDGGENWWVQMASGEPAYSLHAVALRDARVGWGAGNLGHVFATSDGGIEWVPTHGVVFEYFRAAGRMLGIDPDRFDLKDVWWLLDLGRYQEARRLADRLSGDFASDPQVNSFLALQFYESGRDLYRDDRFEEAIEVYGSGIALAARTPAGFDPGLEHFELAVRLHFERGRALRRVRRYDEAIADLEEARRLAGELAIEAPSFNGLARLRARIGYYLGLSLRSADRYPEALVVFEEATRIDASYRYGFRGLGEAAFALGDYVRSIDALETALELRPDYEAAMNYLAWVLATAGLPEFRDAERALGLVEAVLKIEETRARIDTLGAAWLLASDVERAFDAYRRAADWGEGAKELYAGELRYLGCLESEAEPSEEIFEAALRACLERGLAPYAFREKVERIERLMSIDPALALRHLEALEQEAPDHPEVTRLRAEAVELPRE